MRARNFENETNQQQRFARQWFVRSTMNLSQQYSIRRENDCKNFFFQTVPLRYSSFDPFYGLLVAAAVFNLVAFPFTVLLNVLTMVAVKTKRRLQTHPNILLACLALTDLMVGLVVQPLHITKTIFILQGKDAHDFCDIEVAFSVSFTMSMFATVFHLFLISGERYLAIKRTFTHATVVTKARLIMSSAVAWLATIILFLFTFYLHVAFWIGYLVIIAAIALLQIFVYKEARRHENRILSQQVSVEARARFKQEKKALKLTTIILVTIFLCFVLPSVLVFITWRILSETFSSNVKTSFRHLLFVPVIINSALNPVIYTVRKKEFRVAFIELLLRKRFQEEEEFNRNIFGLRSNPVTQQNGQKGVEQEQKVEGKNVSYPDDIHEDNLEVRICGVDFDEKITTATQDTPVSLGALDSKSKLIMEEHGKGKISVHDKTKQENDPEVVVAGPSFAVDWKTNDSAQNESLNEHNKTKLTEKDSQDQVGPEKEEMTNEYEEIRMDSAWNRNEEDIEPISKK